jgi:hypothetical protein
MSSRGTEIIIFVITYRISFGSTQPLSCRCLDGFHKSKGGRSVKSIFHLLLVSILIGHSK